MAVLGRFGPPLALMAVIFFLSAQPGLDSGLAFDDVLRKGAHMAEYGLLWFLWWRALGYGHPGAAIAIAIGYAISDEIHQSYVTDRHGSAWDVAIDAAGVGLAGALVIYGGWKPRPESDRRSG